MALPIAGLRFAASTRGHPINLAAARPAATAQGLISEFVHAEIPFSADDWTPAGGLLEPTSGATPGVLMDHRRAHYLQLCQEYTKDVVRAWMPNPVMLDEIITKNA